MNLRDSFIKVSEVDFILSQSKCPLCPIPELLIKNVENFLVRDPGMEGIMRMNLSSQ